MSLLGSEVVRQNVKLDIDVPVWYNGSVIKKGLQMEYQVSTNANADREYLYSYREAIKTARALSMKQSEPVIIDVHDGEEMCDYYYQVVNGKVSKKA